MLSETQKSKLNFLLTELEVLYRQNGLPCKQTVDTFKNCIGCLNTKTICRLYIAYTNIQDFIIEVLDEGQ